MRGSTSYYCQIGNPVLAHQAWGTNFQNNVVTLKQNKPRQNETTNFVCVSVGIHVHMSVEVRGQSARVISLISHYLGSRN